MAKRLGALLESLPAVRQAQALAVLQKKFDAILPDRFRGEADVVSLDAGELRILCGNGAVASRLRLEAASLAVRLQGKGLPVQRVSIRVRPASKRVSPSRAKAPLPSAARQAFEAAAAALDDGEVKAAVEKLLRHHTP